MEIVNSNRVYLFVRINFAKKLQQNQKKTHLKVLSLNSFDEIFFLIA